MAPQEADDERETRPKQLITAVRGLPRSLAEHGTPVWRSAAIIGALVIAVATWRLGLDVLPLAFDAEARLAEFRRLSAEELVAQNSTELADMRISIDRLGTDVTPAGRYGNWMARFSPAVAWLPALDHEVVAWGTQLGRLQSDLRSASTLLGSSSNLLDIYGDAQDALLTRTTRASLPTLGVEARGLESSFATSFNALADWTQAGRRFRPLFSVPRVRDAMVHLDEVERRMLAVSRIGSQASDLLVELLEVGDRVQPLIRQLAPDGQEVEPLTVSELKATLSEMDAGIQFALAKADRLAKLATDGDLSGALSERLDLLRSVLGALMNLERATMVGFQAVEPALQDAERSAEGLMGSDGALVNALNGIADHADEIAGALVLLDDAEQTLSDLASRDDPTQQLRGLEDLVEAAQLLNGGLRLMMSLAPIGAELIGVNSTQRYLVLGQSADELRATGGF